MHAGADVSTDGAPGDTGAERDASASEPVDLHEDGRRREVEAEICNLAGVLAARLVPGFDRPVDELHVVATPDRNPKQLVRDIQSLLFARSGVSIDHRVVSIVHFETAPAATSGNTPESGPGDRVEITHVSATQQGLDIQAGVRISDGRMSYLGTAEGPASATGRRRAIARSALDAVRPLLSRDESVELEGVTVGSVLGHLVVTSLISSYGPGGSETITGTSVIREDENLAIARSVLDAMNRRIVLRDERETHEPAPTSD